MKEYNLEGMAHNGYVNCDIQWVMYGLAQSGMIVNFSLTQCLESHGYYYTQNKTGLWNNKWITVMFSLVVENFGVKYVGEQNAKQL